MDVENFDVLVQQEDLTWRDILYEVLEGMNLWDIDLIELATRYSQKVDEMKEMNFRIPANVILVCSVLLRMKADILTPRNDEANFSDAFNFIFNSDYPISALVPGDVEPYPISIKPARVMTRRVTAEELIAAIQGALSERVKKQSTLMAAGVNGNGRKEIVIEPEVNIMALIEDTYRRVMEILAKKEVALFSELTRTNDDIRFTFLSLLHLWNDEKVTLSQERLFGEIYIKPAN
ncbi:MAG: segregation/condensation protein A [Candidatus Altiarchaeota archaeon]|nr:segregation/condensation protein A [Candidatus Altiarchaeota archaeon]